MSQKTIDQILSAFHMKVGSSTPCPHLILGIPELDSLIKDSVKPGGIIEIHGGPGSGKTSVLAKIMRTGKAFPPIAFVDCDHSMTTLPDDQTLKWSAWIYTRPKDTSEARDIIRELGMEGPVRLFLVDSINSLPIPNSTDEEPIGLHQKILCGLANDLSSTISRVNGYAVVTSQIRMGNKSASGKAIFRHAAVRLLFERVSTIKRKREAGCLVRATLLPNRSGLRGSTEFEVLYPRR